MKKTRNLMSALREQDDNKQKTNWLFNIAHEHQIKDDLILGGTVLLAWGAKQILLPTFMLTTPVLFTITTMATTITGYRYLNSLWKRVLRKNKESTGSLIGLAVLANLLTGGILTALSAVWLLNLSQYWHLKISRAQTQATKQADDPQKPASKWTYQQYLVAIPKVTAWVVLGYQLWSVLFVYLPILLSPFIDIISFLQISSYGPLLFILAYIGLVLGGMSQIPLGVVAGFVFGSILGAAYALVGVVIAAGLGYVIGRFLGQDILDNLQDKSLLRRYMAYLHENPLETVIILNISLIPMGLVSYLAGFVQLDILPFIVGTTLVLAPKIIFLSFLGASFQGQNLRQIFSVDPEILRLGLIIVVGAMVWRFIKKRLSPRDDLIKALTSDTVIKEKLNHVSTSTIIQTEARGTTTP